MKLSNKGRYAIAALFDMAFYNAGHATQIKDISSRQGIPARFLEQIFQELKREGLVVSKRGPQGGYNLARAADDIRLGDIVRALEGPLSLSEGKLESAPRKKPAADTRRVTESVLGDLSRQIEACFDQISVAGLCSRAEELGVVRLTEQRLVYFI